MHFLGSLGIDTNLLIAQIINFGLLLWLLKKFVYVPIINRIEKDEGELQQAQTQTQALTQEKKTFAEEKQKEIIESKKHAEEILSEAELITERMRSQSQEKLKREANLVLTQAHTRLQSEKTSFEEKISSNIKDELAQKVVHAFDANTSLTMKKALQRNIFFPDLLDRVSKLSFGRTKDVFLSGRTILSFALPMTLEEKKQFENTCAQKTKNIPEITYTKDEKLMSGFRFEIAGTLIESSLSNMLADNIAFAINAEK